MAKILIHTLVFAPDGVSTSQLLSELAQDLRGYGHEIVILTTQPHYNRDLDAEAKQPLKRHCFGMYYTSSHHGMRVIHTVMPRKGEGTSNRLRDYLIFHILSLILGLFLIGRQDVVIAPSPPLTIGVIGWMLAVMKGGKFIYNVQEIYPALMVQMGILSEQSTLYKILKRMERFVYDSSWRIVTISDMFAEHVIKQGISPQKVVTIPNFVDADFIQPGSKDNALANQYGLVDKYVILYAGNIGMTQSFDTITEVMQRLVDMTQIHFLIVGDGARRAYIEAQIAEKHLTNVTLLPYQPRHVVPDIYATGDVSLVPLIAGTAKTTIPSKIYTIMASGRPALVSVDLDSEIVAIVQDAQCGLAVPPDDVDALEAGIRHMFAQRDMYRDYGMNGRRVIEQRFSRQAVSIQWDQLLRAIKS